MKSLVLIVAVFFGSPLFAQQGPVCENSASELYQELIELEESCDEPGCAYQAQGKAISACVKILDDDYVAVFHSVAKEVCRKRPRTVGQLSLIHI